MSISLKRIQAIFMKDYKEFSRNYAVSMMILFPLFFAFLYRSNGEGAIQMYGFVLNFTLAMLTSFVQACLISEEKERNTLRSLMMTPASMLDILLGKSAVVLVISTFILALSTYIFGYSPTHIGILIVALILSMVLYIALGTICGLFSKSVLESSMAVFPVLLIFTAGPYASLFEEKIPFLKIAQYLPSSQLIELLQLMEASATSSKFIMPIVIMLIWAIVVTAISFILYKKRLMDE